jgi:hypothetical protein
MNRNILIISIIAVVAAVVLIVLLTRHHKNKDVSSQMIRGNTTNVIMLTENGTYNLTSEESGSTLIVYTNDLSRQSQLIINLPDIITNNLNGIHYKIMVFDDPENSGVSNAILSAYPNSPSPITTTIIPYPNKLTKKLKSQSEITLDEINLRSFYVVSYNGFWYVSI